MSSASEVLSVALDHQRGGRWREAEALYREILGAQPECAEAYGDLAILLYQVGRLGEAEQACRQAIARQPASAEARANLAAILQAQGRYWAAEASAREALALRPDHAEAHNNLGNALERLERFEEAETCYRRALELRPDFALACHNLANVLERRRKWPEAESYYRRAIELLPEFAEAYNNLGALLQQQARWEEAIECYGEALRLRPAMAEAHNGLGVALQWDNRDAEALVCYERALAINPAFPEAHYNRATLRLRRGQFRWGWDEYEWRWRLSDVAWRHFRQPLWDGSPLEGRTILLHAEMGYGDTVQFARYAPLVAQRGATVVLECQPRLVPLMESLAGVSRVIPRGAPLPEFDVHAPLLSLPRLFQTDLASIPSRVPYLSVAPERIDYWRERIGAAPGLKVGLVWAGNPDSKSGLKRFLPLAAFAPLGAVNNVRWFSLQRGPQAAELAAPPPGLTVTPLEEETGEVTDTAAAILNLDLVISADTMVAHLAGALAKPVWVLLASSPEWRWMLDRQDSPWYPTARLFRQARLGDWQEVMARVAEALRNVQRT
jgi:tetratricopeptide (TPR) repeat protein